MDSSEATLQPWKKLGFSQSTYYRRKKVASNLFDYLLTEAPSQVGLITLEVNENNVAAINFYKSFGLEIISRRKGYYKNDDAYLMGRSIEK